MPSLWLEKHTRTTKVIKMRRKYGDWEDHPEWQNLCNIVHKYEQLKSQAEQLRAKIQREVFGDEKK